MCCTLFKSENKALSKSALKKNRFAFKK